MALKQAPFAGELIASLRGGLIGSDINGEISHCRCRSWWKHRLSAIDDQPSVDLAERPARQAQQHALNLGWLLAIDAASG
jgi:hypothetical protein